MAEELREAQGTQDNYMSWTAHCLECSKIRKGGHGLFCGNFLLRRGSFPPCKAAWCGKCYQESPNDNFPRLDDRLSGSDLEVDLAYTQNRYRCARDGDHLMGVPFECDLCSFRNVTGRDPVKGSDRDDFTLAAIRRVLLDVMWAREPDTVASNWSRSKRDYRMAVDNLSIDYRTILPALGNPTVGDRVGLGVALTTVLASLRPGKHSSNVQFDTIRKTQTWYGNAYDAGENFSCETVVGLDQKKQYVSTAHTFGKWFTRFMRGARLRMGMVRRQNEALTSKLVLGVCAEAEREWTQARTDLKRRETEDAVCFMLIAFGAGLRGEEVPLVSLEGLLHFWEETRRGEEEERFIMVTLSGRFKGEVDSRWHMVPISDKTHSKIPFRLWMERIMHRRANHQRRTKGWLFETRTGARAKFGRYDDKFRALVSLARATNARLVPQVIEAEDFSLWRSPRRGAVLETTQRGWTPRSWNL